MPDDVKHRNEFHPTPLIKEEVDLPDNENIVDSTSGEGKRSCRKLIKNNENQVVSMENKQFSEDSVQTDMAGMNSEDKSNEEIDSAEVVLEESQFQPKRRKNSDNSDNCIGRTKKPGDRRRFRIAHLAEEDVRVKAEAALQELSLPKKNKTQPTGSKCC